MNYTSNVKVALLKKDPVPIEGNGKPSTSEPALQRSLAYKDFKMMIRLSN